MIKAAGVLIISTEGKALFVQRTAQGDQPGVWAIPGGKLEEGENTVDAAIRETMEEVKFTVPKNKLEPWTRRIWAPPLPDAIPGTVAAVDPTPVDFTTYLLKGVKEFQPELNEEHSAYAWAPLNNPPMPLHPGMDVAIARFTMNELDIARAIRDGMLTSPQWYQNIALFAIRITGTGAAYRPAHAEVAIRSKEHYLNPDFLERCNGLPVILQHPKNTILDTEEFKERVIGTCMLPYIKNDEVWSIAKIYDEPSALMMESQQLSTSPSVTWRGGTTKTIKMNGLDYLIEGEPNLLDHIAICPQGVWDKGGDPLGVDTTAIRGDEAMDKETLEKVLADVKANQTRNDEAIASLNGTLAGLAEQMKGLGGIFEALKKRADEDDEKKETERKDAARRDAEEFKFTERKDGESDEDLKGRRDEEEKKCADAFKEAGESEDMAADKARKRRDSADEEDKKKADSARADEARKLDLARGDEVSKLREELAMLKGQLPTQLTEEQMNQFGSVQSRADEVMMLLGGRARAPMIGESLLSYRRHFAGELKKHSSRWKDIPLDALAANDAAFANVEEEIYRDAKFAASSPASVPEGTLRETVTRGDGHTYRTFQGRPSAWMTPLAGDVAQAVTVFNRPKSQNPSIN